MAIDLVGTNLVAGERLLLAELDSGLSVEADSTGVGAFLRARAPRSSSRLLFNAGKLLALRRFAACHRYEPYWMKPALAVSDDFQCQCC